MKRTNYFKKTSTLIIAGTFVFCLAKGQTTGLSGTGANTQGAGTAGTDNTNIGSSAGTNITTGGNQNTNVGKNSSTAITTGDDNTPVKRSVPLRLV